MDTYTMLAVIIALVSSSIVMGLAVKQNIRLNEENAWLRSRNKELKKQMENMVEKPW